jgi:tetratricopeptide (TPR) repeat protein
MESPESRPVPNTPYVVGQTSGLWYQPGFQCQTELVKYLEKSQIPEAEVKVNEQLAEALWVNWMKKIPGLVADLMVTNTSLADAISKRTGQAVTNSSSWPLVSFTDGPHYSLFTCVHGFQKLSVETAPLFLKQAHKNLKFDGHLFLRMPDRDVKGYERDLTPERYQTAACFWNLEAFLELLSQYPLFTIAETYTIEPGQRDYILRPLTKRPTVCIGMIAKNEERDLPRCLKSLDGVADGLVLIDTGSTDKTMEIARTWAKSQGFTSIDGTDPKAQINRYHIEQYLGASEKDEKGDWKLWDFGKARNQFVDQIEAMGFDYVLWMDADDELKQKRLKNLRFLDQFPVQAVQMNSGDLRWPHHRLWKTGLGIKFSGRCHEYPHFGTNRDYYHTDIEIFHDAAPGTGENSNPRNLRILAREFKEEPTARCAFYLANTYKDSSQWDKAVETYRARLAYGPGYLDEYRFAALYMGRCLRRGGKIEEARTHLLKYAAEWPEWAEFWMELCVLEDSQGHTEKALSFALQAKDRPVAPTALFRERNAYTDQPYRNVSWAYEKLGEIEMALKYARQARAQIGGPDADWEKRTERLNKELRAKTPKPEEGPLGSMVYAPNLVPLVADITPKPLPPSDLRTIRLNRPGAMGDIIVTLNCIPALKALHPSAKIIYHCHPSILSQMTNLIRAAGVDEVEPSANLNSTETEPGPHRTVNLIGYPVQAENYPHHPMKRHLIEYFAAEMGVTPSFNQLFLSLPPLPEGPLTTNLALVRNCYITVHPKAGWSMYKNWPMDRWASVCNSLQKQLDIQVVQLGGPDDPKIPGLFGYAMGASFDDNLAYLANATMHMGVDSWTNHATNISWIDRAKDCGGSSARRTRAVILWGSTQSSAAGYQTNRNLSSKLPCSPCFRENPKISQVPLGVCPNPGGQTYEEPQHACMDLLSEDTVLGAALKLWNEITKQRKI